MPSAATTAEIVAAIPAMINRPRQRFRRGGDWDWVVAVIDSASDFSSNAWVGISERFGRRSSTVSRGAGVLRS